MLGSAGLLALPLAIDRQRRVVPDHAGGTAHPGLKIVRRSLPGTLPAAPAKFRASGAGPRRIRKKPAVMSKDPGAQVCTITDERQKMVHCLRRQPPARKPAVDIRLGKRQRARQGEALAFERC